MSAEAPSPGFEGVEKVLEIDFAPGLGEANGLRDIPRADWDAVLTDAKCTILARLSSGDVDSYVLSESSLFVYPRKLVLKTCGTTTLLMCLPRLLELTQRLSLRVEWVAYTRKDFQFPAAQKYPHRGPKEEITYLKELFPEGSAFLMGPVTGDHWLVFVADYVDRATTECVDRTLDMMMFGIDEEVRAGMPCAPREAPPPPRVRGACTN
jgi:S-adenosylmethionine decarboxylase